MVSKLRSQRIADRIREELSEILLQEISDPRLSGVSITDVTVDRELAIAEVYFSALEGSERAQEIQQGFKHASGYLRRSLSQRIELRVFPRLRFHWDPTFERAERIERLIMELHSGDEPQAPELDADDELDGEDEFEVELDGDGEDLAGENGEEGAPG